MLCAYNSNTSEAEVGDLATQQDSVSKIGTHTHIHPKLKYSNHISSEPRHNYIINIFFSEDTNFKVPFTVEYTVLFRTLNNTFNILNVLIIS